MVKCCALKLKSLAKKALKVSPFFIPLPFFVVALLVLFFVLDITKPNPPEYNRIINQIIPTNFPTATPTLIPTPTLPPIPQSHTIPQRLHVYQSFNNCGPATLSMALSYQGIDKPQSELGQILRPFQVPGGDNDDKSVTLEEVANQAKAYGLLSYLRPNGTFEKMQQFIANDIPVVTRTWLQANEDIGHYRVVRGYDKNSQTLTQDDSLQGENLTYSYDGFEDIWVPFNYEYLIIVTPDKKGIVEKILGEELDEKVAWQNALERMENERSNDPPNWHLTFALSRIHYYLGNYKTSIDEFDKIQNQLSFRTLWYQIEPIKSMYENGEYDRVLNVTSGILNNHNRAFSELYIIRGDIYKNQGNLELAKSEYEKAVFYNQNLDEAQLRLSSL